MSPFLQTFNPSVHKLFNQCNLSIYFIAIQFIRPFLNLSIHLSSFNPFVQFSIPTYPTIHPSIHHCTHPAIQLSITPFTYPSNPCITIKSTYLFISPPVHCTTPSQAFPTCLVFGCERKTLGDWRIWVLQTDEWVNKRMDRKLQRRHLGTSMQCEWDNSLEEVNEILACIENFFNASILMVLRSRLYSDREVLMFKKKYAAKLASLLHQGELPLLGIGIIINNILYLVVYPIFPCE